MHDNRHPLEGLRDLARLGVEVAYITALGDDPFSDDMLTGWRREGVSTAHVLRLPPGLYLIRRVTRGHAGAKAPEPWPIHANPSLPRGLFAKCSMSLAQNQLGGRHRRKVPQSGHCVSRGGRSTKLYLIATCSAARSCCT